MKFLRKYIYENAAEIEWKWNYTFNRPICFVQFDDGEKAWSYPEDLGYNPSGLFYCFRTETDCINIDPINQNKGEKP